MPPMFGMQQRRQAPVTMPFGLSKIGATSARLGRQYGSGAAPAPLGQGQGQYKPGSAWGGVRHESEFTPSAGSGWQRQGEYWVNQGPVDLSGDSRFQNQGNSWVNVEGQQPQQPQAQSPLGAQQGGMMSVPSGQADRPFGMTMPQGYSAATRSMIGRAGNDPVMAPGSGNVYYHDDEYNPSAGQRSADNATLDRYRMYDATAGSGPYDGSRGGRHFGPLASPQQHTPTPPPVGTVYGGGSRVVDIDGRQVLMGPNVSEGTYRQSEMARQAQRGSARRRSWSRTGRTRLRVRLIARRD
jgi:hypothetical protein